MRIHRSPAQLSLAGAVLLLAISSAYADSLDTVTLKDGTSYRGQIVKEEPGYIVFRVVLHAAPSATIQIERDSIKSIERASFQARETLLRHWLQPLHARTKIDMDALKRIKVERSRFGDLTTYRAEGVYFVVEATAGPGETSEMALYIDDVFRAYRALFDTFPKPECRAQVLLLSDQRQFMDLQRRLFNGRAFDNPAAYLPEHNVVIAYRPDATAEKTAIDGVAQEKRTELLKHRDELSQYQHDLRGLLGDAKYDQGKVTAELRRVGSELSRIDAALHQFNSKVKELKAEADERARQELTNALVHEGFHAFADVVLEADDMPRWLNEGLAMYFEACTQPNSKDMATAFLAVSTPMPLDKLIVAESGVFSVDHGSDADDLRRSNAAYLQSWALVSYLINEAKTDKPRLAEYLVNARKTGGAVSAFESLFGHSMSELGPKVRRHIEAGSRE